MEKFISRALHTLKGAEIDVLETPLYFSPPLQIEEANILSWPEFSSRINPIEVVALGNEIQALVVQKYKTWSFRDVCIIVGSENRNILLLQDLNFEEGEAFLDLNFQIAQRAMDEKNRVVHIGYGFNPEDDISGTHSLRRLHTRVYVAESDFLNEQKESINFNRRKLNWFDRLSLIEPFAQIYYDFIYRKLKDGCFRDFLNSSPHLRLNNGYISFNLINIGQLKEIFPDLTQMLAEMQQEYQTIERIFTDKKVSPYTGRYILFPKEEREQRLQSYLEISGNWLSSESRALISCLVEKIKEAEPRREEAQIDDAKTLWITKGFAGGVNFAFFWGQNQVRFDFIPRVISTSNMQKLLHGENNPCLLERTPRNPTNSEVKEIEDYMAKVKAACRSFQHVKN